MANEKLGKEVIGFSRVDFLWLQEALATQAGVVLRRKNSEKSAEVKAIRERELVEIDALRNKLAVMRQSLFDKDSYEKEV